MTAFEEALVAVMRARIETALTFMERHGRDAVTDPREAQRALGEVQMRLSQLREDVRCLQRLHEMAEEMEEATG